MHAHKGACTDAYYLITQAMYLVRSSVKFVVRFVAISSIIHHHRVAVLNQVDRMSLLECAQFYTESVGNGEFLVSHGPTINVLGGRAK